MNTIVHLSDKVSRSNRTWDDLINAIITPDCFGRAFEKNKISIILKSDRVAFGDDILAKLIKLNVIKDEAVRSEKEKQRMILDKDYAEKKRAEQEEFQKAILKKVNLIGESHPPFKRFSFDQYDDDYFFTTQSDLPEDRNFQVTNDGKIIEILYVFFPTEENITLRERSMSWERMCTEAKKARQEEDKRFPLGYVEYVLWDTEGCEGEETVISYEDAQMKGLFGIHACKSPFEERAIHRFPIEDDYYDNKESLYDDEDSYDGKEYSSKENGWRADTWDSLTDGMYGDMPDDFDGDYDFLGR